LIPTCLRLSPIHSRMSCKLGSPSLLKMSESLKNQGSNPFRIFNLRALPDGHVKVMKDDIHSQNQKHKDLQEIAADEGGDYYTKASGFEIGPFREKSGTLKSLYF